MKRIDRTGLLIGSVMYTHKCINKQLAIAQHVNSILYNTNISSKCQALKCKCILKIKVNPLEIQLHFYNFFQWFNSIHIIVYNNLKY